MKIAIGPKGRQTMLRMMFGYRGHGPKWRVHRFGNGVAVRLGGFHAMIWWPRGVALSEA
jgi:hypothetical protein